MVFKYIAFVLLLALVAGCSTDSSIKIPPETYFSEGQKLYSKKKFEQAIEKWKKVKESYSSPILTTAAELKIADAQFADKNYIEAAASYEDFRKLHPDNPKADYALYKIGLSNFKQFRKIDTDQTPLRNAVSSFESFLKEYPDSGLTEEVRQDLRKCRIKQAEYEIYVGRFYYRTDKYQSAIGRLKRELEVYPDSPVNDKALYYLGKSYMETGEMEKARDTFEQLVKNYKNGEYSKEARELLEKTSSLVSSRKKSQS